MTMTDHQIEDACKKLGNVLREHRDQISSAAAQTALRTHNIGMMMFAPFRDQAVSPLEAHNLRVNSDGWVKRTDPNGQEYLESPTGDMWEIINCADPALNGEQLFTWGAAMREAEAAGKRIPTDEEFDKLLETKADMPNLVLAGYRGTNGSFDSLSSLAYFWSSSDSGSDAWSRFLCSSDATVCRYDLSQAYGFSIRCLKD